jgi:nucleoside-diphosphate-sugar epimerase
MKIFVTGAAGFIGRATMEYGADRGHQMVGCDVAGTDECPGVATGCVTDLDFLTTAMVGCDAVVHLAAVHGGHLADGMSHAEFYRINVGGTDNVFQAALANDIRRVVSASSLDILCGSDWMLSGAQKYSERTPPNPDSLYALTKLMGEDMGHFYHATHSIRYCGLRYVYVTGSCSEPTLIAPLSLISRVTLREDCAIANILACTSERVFDDVLLIGPENPLDSRDLVKAVNHPEAVLEKHWPGALDDITAAGFKPTGMVWPACDITRAKQVLGWVPRYDFDWFLDRIRTGGLRQSE